ncbi:hypothetical protein M3Y98_00791800 [Aphelenchoides besseyi]|nr:hypothetical protein M3Y98_00791800 [Aphelenchoides besseyi]
MLDRKTKIEDAKKTLQTRQKLQQQNQSITLTYFDDLDKWSVDDFMKTMNAIQKLFQVVGSVQPKYFPGIKDSATSGTGKKISEAATATQPVQPEVAKALDKMFQFLTREFQMLETMIGALEHQIDQVIVTAKWDAYAVREPLRFPYEKAVPRLLKNQSTEERQVNAQSLKDACYTSNKISSIIRGSNIAMTCDYITPSEVEIDFQVIMLLDFVAKRVTGPRGPSKNRLDIFYRLQSLKSVSEVEKKVKELKDDIAAKSLKFSSEIEAQDHVYNSLSGLGADNTTGPGQCLLSLVLKIYSYDYAQVNEVVKILLEDAGIISTTSLLCATVYAFPNATSELMMKNLMEDTIDRQSAAILGMQKFFVDAYDKVFQNVIPKLAVYHLDECGLEDPEERKRLNHMADWIYRNVSTVNDIQYKLSILVHNQESDSGIKAMFWAQGNLHQKLCDTRTEKFCMYISRHINFPIQDAEALLINMHPTIKDAMNAVALKSIEEASQYLQEKISNVIDYFPSIILMIYEGSEVESRYGIRNDVGIFNRYWMSTGSRYVFFQAAGNYTVR